MMLYPFHIVRPAPDCGDPARNWGPGAWGQMVHMMAGVEGFEHTKYWPQARGSLPSLFGVP